MSQTALIAAILGPALIVVAFLLWQVKKFTVQLNEQKALNSKYQGIIDVEAEKQRILTEKTAEVAELEAKLARIKEGGKEWIQKFQAQKQKMQEDSATRIQQEGQEFEAKKQLNETQIAEITNRLQQLRAELEPLEEKESIRSFGFYEPRYDFSSSSAYQSRLDSVRTGQKQLVKTNVAAVCPVEWEVAGSKVEGRKMVSRTLKLMLRAFNGECDAATAKVKYNNVHIMEGRINKAWSAINELNRSLQCTISSEYLNLKLQELYLVHEYQEKVQAEKEEQRRIREEMREEEIARRELERAQQEAEREETRYEDMLTKAKAEAERSVGAKQEKLQWQIEELERRLAEAHEKKERAIAQAQLTKSGHVYVISNVGSFGEDVYKIGMTRRLDPLDRVRELGDASVPFLFDVHAIIYSTDAPALEAALHRKFQHRRVNRINERKEFFRVTIDEIAEVVKQHHGEIDIIHDAEAVEYRKTVAMLQEMQTVNGTLSNSVMQVT